MLLFLLFAFLSRGCFQLESKNNRISVGWTLLHLNLTHPTPLERSPPTFSLSGWCLAGRKKRIQYSVFICHVQCGIFHLDLEFSFTIHEMTFGACGAPPDSERLRASDSPHAHCR
ncbi:hypothetical protein QBC46DRAFT_392219 [Diplogelasinospora grovesii]|uniref:Secreted protein n=1 Tax=Diplogelasinospora grovesii TaxID=303347 RepID=A0AAN6N2X8_9PEZI|nr:hypothetical protein QBC46DRAFT_392219 [Diplogelasinospora grovesii]